MHSSSPMLPYIYIHMLASFGLLGILALGFDSSSTTISPACECIIFDGYGGYQTNGTFMSPNFPAAYEPDIQCLLYTFVGGENEIVQLTFADFVLQEVDPDTKKCQDYVRIYLDLSTAEVNESSAYQVELCGNHRPKILTYFSKSRALIFEFHSDSFTPGQGGTHFGFLGDFSFLDKRKFLTDGKMISSPTHPEQCHYMITSSTDGSKSGKIFSPFFPYHYPSNTRCKYVLKGQPKERVHITFKEISLPLAKESCLNADTVILVYDHHPKLSRDRRTLIRHRHERHHRHRRSGTSLIGQFCGHSLLPESVISSGPEALIIFNAYDNSKYQGKGFHAEYEFIESLPKMPSEMHPTLIPGTPWITDIGQDRPKCEFNIDGSDSSNWHPEGKLIKSPVYQDSYPRGIKCTYTFTTTSIMRTQLIFTEFDLYLPPTINIHSGETSGKCHDEYDHVAVYVDVDGRQSVLDVFCGQATPPQVMSARNIITLEFITHSYPGVNKTKNKGFKFLYKFVSDFGIKSGKRLNNFTCGFSFNSNDTSNGTIYSPNYPGYYPRKTDCFYEFIGQPNEQVNIFFTYFDVEGYSQCENETESDYVLFSHFQTADRKNIRFCGSNRPKKQTSEKNYLRMIFHANNIFDATGFFALYQFSTKPKRTLSQVKHRSSSASSLYPTFFLLSPFIFITVQLIFKLPQR